MVGLPTARPPTGETPPPQAPAPGVSPAGLAFAAPPPSAVTRSSPADPRRRPLRSLARFLARVVGALLLGTYYLVTRVVVVIVALYLLAYFLAGSSPVKRALQDLLAAALPGSISAATIQWGPAPWHLRVAEPRVLGFRGEEVIRARALEASIDWGSTVSGLIEHARAPLRHPLTIHFDRVDVLEPWARIEVDEEGLVGIERAFVLPDEGDPPPPGPPPNLDIRIRVVRIIDGGALVEAPGFRLEVHGANAVSDYALLGAGDNMVYDIPRTSVARVILSFDLFSNLPAPFVLEARDVVVEDFAWRELSFQWRHATGLLPGGRFEGRGGLDAAHSNPPWFGSGRVELDPGSPITATLLRGLVEGPLSIGIDGSGDVEQLSAAFDIESPALELAGLPLADLTLHGRISPRGNPLEKRLHAIHVDSACAGLAGGRLAITDLAWEPHRPNASTTASAASFPPPLDTPRDLFLTAELTALDLDALADRLGIALPDLPGRGGPLASGRLHLAHLPRQLGQRHTLRLALEPSTLAFHVPPLQGLAPTWTVSGGLVWTVSERTFGEGETTDLPIIEALDLIGLNVDAGDVRARLAGRVDLSAGLVDLEPYLRLGSITPLARGLISRESAPAEALPAGRLVLKNARIRGPLIDPSLLATINWTGARLSGRELGQVMGKVSLSEGVLAVNGLESRSAVARFAIDGRLALFAPTASPPGPPPTFVPRLRERLVFDIRTRNVEGVLVTAFTDAFGPSARLAIDHGRLEGVLDDLPGSLSGRGRLRLTQVQLAGESELRLDGLVAISPGLGLDVSELAITLDSGSVWRGSLQLLPGPRSGDERSRMDLLSRPINARLDISETRLESLSILAEAAPDLEGFVRGQLSLGGSLSRPSLIGTLTLEEARFGPIPLGTARLSVTTRAVTPVPPADSQADPAAAASAPVTGARRYVEVSAFDDEFFPGYSLERAQLLLEAGQPRRLELAVRARDRELGDFVSAFATQSVVDLVGSASAELDLDLVSGLLAMRLVAAPGDLTLLIPEKNARWTNDSEALLVSDTRRFTLHPLTLVPVATAARPPDGVATDAERIDACGSFDPRSSRLDLQLAANLDLARVPGLADVLSVARGRLLTARDPLALREVGDDTCLQNRIDIVHVVGRLEAPEVTGRIATTGLSLVPRGSGREIRIRDGSVVAIRPGDSKHLHRLEVGPDQGRFEGDLDDGSFGLSGHIDFFRFRPRALDLRVAGADIFLQSPGEFALTASPFGRVTAADLDGPSPNLLIAGDLSISEGRFSKSFDTFARALGGALGVRADAYSTSLLDELPWLAAARLDVNAVANDFQIQTALPLARTDLRARLDLTLRGTLAEPRLFRRIDILPGGTLSYFVFERTFTVNQGSVDFDGDPERPLVDVTAQTQITYLQRAQSALRDTDEKEVGIALRMTGRVPDLKIELSSDDQSLDQADIQSLLITGKPRGDLDRAQESQLVSADLAAVINSVFAAPFVRRASVGLDQRGGLEYRVGTCFAPGLCFDTTTVSDDIETTLRAKFSLAIGDDVVCEGTLRRSDGAATSAQDTYQARCRYRIPLE